MSLPLSSSPPTAAVPISTIERVAVQALSKESSAARANLQTLSSDQAQRAAKISQTTVYLNPNYNNLSVPSIPVTIPELETHLKSALSANKEFLVETFLMREAAEHVIAGPNANILDLCFCIPMTQHRQQLKKQNLLAQNLRRQAQNVLPRKSVSKNAIEGLRRNEEAPNPKITEKLTLQAQADAIHNAAIQPLLAALKGIILQNLHKTGAGFECLDDEFLHDEYLNPCRFREIRQNTADGYEVVGYHLDLGGLRLNFVFPETHDWQTKYFPVDNWFVSLSRNAIVSTSSDLELNKQKLQRLMGRRLIPDDFNHCESPFFRLINRLTHGFEGESHPLSLEIFKISLTGLRVNHGSSDKLAADFELFLNREFTSQIPAPVIRHSDRPQILILRKLKDRAKTQFVAHMAQAIKLQLTSVPVDKITQAFLADHPFIAARLNETSKQLQEIGRQISSAPTPVLHAEYNRVFALYQQRLAKLDILVQKSIQRIAKVIQLENIVNPSHELNRIRKIDTPNVNFKGIQRTFRENVNAQFIPHSGFNAIGKMMACLNTFRMLMGIPEEALRSDRCQTIATAWLNQKVAPKLLIKFTTLLRDNPKHMPHLLAIVQGLFFYAWAHKQNGLTAYTHPFTENQTTIRWSLGWKHDQGEHFVNITHHPVQLTADFLDSWKRLQAAFKGDEEALKCLAALPEDLGLQAPPLIEANRFTLIKQLLNAFDNVPIAYVLSTQFPNAFRALVDFCKLLEQDKEMPREHLVYIQHKHIQFRLRQCIHEQSRLGPDPITELQRQLLAWTQQPEQTDLNVIQKLVGQIGALKKYLDEVREESNPKKIRELRIRLEPIAIAIFGYVRQTLNAPSMLGIRTALNLMLSGNHSYLFLYENRDFWTTRLLEECNNLCKDASNLAAREPLERYLRVIERWDNKSPKLDAIIKTIRNDSINFLVPAVNGFKTLPKEAQQNTLDALKNKFSIGLSPDELRAFLPLINSIVGHGLELKDTPIFIDILNFATNIVPQLTLEQVRESRILELAKAAVTFKKKVLQKMTVDTLQKYQHLGFSLIDTFVKKDPSSNTAKEIQAFMLDNMLVLVASATTAKSKHKLTHHSFSNFSKAIRSLESDQKALHVAYGTINELAKDDALFTKNMRMITREMLTLAASINMVVCAKFLINPNIQAQLSPNAFFELTWKVINKFSLSADKEVLSSAYALWKMVQDDAPLRETENWLSTMVGTMQLFQMLSSNLGHTLNGKTETFTQYIIHHMQNGECHLQQLPEEQLAPLLKGLAQLAAANQGAAKLIAGQLQRSLVASGNRTEDAAKILIRKLLAPQTPPPSAETLQELLGSHEKSVDKLCPLIEQCLKENSEAAFKIALLAFQKITSQQPPLHESVIRIGLHLFTVIPQSWRNTNEHDALLAGLIRCLGVFLKQCTADQRTATFQAIFATGKPQIYTALWHEITKVSNPQELFPICKELCSRQDAKLVELVHSYFVQSAHKDIQICLLLVETYSTRLNPSSARMIQADILDGGILMDKTVPLAGRTQAFRLICEFFANYRADRDSPAIGACAANLSTIWDALAEEHRALQQPEAFTAVAQVIYAPLTTVLMKVSSDAALLKTIALLKAHALLHAPDIIAKILENIASLPPLTYSKEVIAALPNDLKQILTAHQKPLSDKQVELLLIALNKIANDPKKTFATLVCETAYAICELEQAGEALKQKMNQDTLTHLIASVLPFCIIHKREHEIHLLNVMIDDNLEKPHEKMVSEKIKEFLLSIHRSLKTLSLDDLENVKEVLQQLIRVHPLIEQYNIPLGHSMVKRLLEKMNDPSVSKQWPLILDFYKHVIATAIYDENQLDEYIIFELKIITGLIGCQKENFSNVALEKLEKLLNRVSLEANVVHLQSYLSALHLTFLRQFDTSTPLIAADRYLNIFKALFALPLQTEHLKICLETYAKMVKAIIAKMPKTQLIEISLKDSVNKSAKLVKEAGANFVLNRIFADVHDKFGKLLASHIVRWTEDKPQLILPIQALITEVLLLLKPLGAKQPDPKKLRT